MIAALRAQGEEQFIALGLLNAVHAPALQHAVQLAREGAERQSVHGHENINLRPVQCRKSRAAKDPAFPSIPQFYAAQKQKKRTSPVSSSIGCGRLGLNLVDVLGVHVSVGAILESDLRPVAVKLDNLHNIAAMDDVDGSSLVEAVARTFRARQMTT